MSEPTPIPPGERRELRSVLRSQMKVLRAEVKQREAELVAEAEQQITERYAEDDKRADELQWRIRQVADKANAELENVLREYDNDAAGRWARMDAFPTPRVRRRDQDRAQLRRAMEAGIAAQVKQALLDLDRQEADLLKSLAMEGLETDAARAFLGEIPTVAELVPSKRLQEIEANFDQETQR